MSSSMTNGRIYEVGKNYMVPAIKTRMHCNAFQFYRSIFRGAWVPVMGPLHRDAGVVGFPYLHWHIDLRFCSKALWKRILGRERTPPNESRAFALPLQKHPSNGGWSTGWGGHPVNEYGEDLHDSWVEGGVVMRRMKYQREFPKWPRALPSWLPKLEKECAGLRLKGMVCPHRGIPLDNCPRDGDVVTCPGHGLQWNVKTGELVT